MENKPLLTLEEAKEMIATCESLDFNWKYPPEYGSASLPGPGPGYRINHDVDDEAAQRDPRSKVRINGIPTTPEVARQAWLLCIDPKYRHLA